MPKSSKMPEQVAPKPRARSLKFWIAIGFLTLALAILTVFVVSYLKNRQELSNLRQTEQELISLKELSAQAISDEALVAQVGEHYLLPNETPTIATVEDITKLADQPFFRHAQNGDKVLMYPESAKAILYRPEISKIVEATTLAIKNEPKATADSEPNN